MKPLISVHEADRLIAHIRDDVPAIKCPLGKAAGRILREDLYADRPLPPFDRVMMDGYAIRFADLASSGAQFTVTAQMMAGDAPDALSDAPGSAVEIMTGAVLPEGADTVIPYEATERTDDAFIIVDPSDVELGQYIHRFGSDYCEGSVLVGQGCILGPAELGVAASCGYAEVLVSVRPRIAVVGTGDELVPVDAKPLPHQIRASNAVAMESALGMARFHVGQIDHWADDAEAGMARLRELLDQNDVIVIAGAVSKGQRDWIPEALDEEGECIFHGVKQRPGKPMGMWRTADGKTIFALPGNPVSALVGLHRYVIPFLKRREGQVLPVAEAALSEDVHFNPPLTWFLPVKILADGTAQPTPVNNSGDYARLCAADGFVELDAASSRWTAGHVAPFYSWSK
ncbi:molybdopterin molybdotransferase MoeA [Cerasicoccus fimbriatus]|uniref:molybdopterin molybdotransferase MoeA n=1 Tax=Cerasicoccus fimbriatus TaxID=3014554 RepID=UPI0022B548C8|nr:molybdopterin molybdotransferase MoeA [Cerasicoccus sp. TK19100]